ncbi:C4-dicarboxylate ABC transporter [Ancylobacter sp. 6x-1]|uniref:C4-dicarboxylate ABC transporter n=1 Tax=Ancylobacter crimeensis TaxID=2579147 RepID=A0ABT0D849_9HYPH|nr:C4-dicarboxylate ABC transporter [Ancylobacter crimeensis]MCK0196106.1 C4-dicarboxylate ABC transporter [Ancylobacter crimeensis]
MASLASAAPPLPAKDRSGLVQGVVRHFTPNWFTVTMGTGALALALNALPGTHAVLHGVAVVLWLANIGLFALFTALYGARWMLFPHEAACIFAHPVMSMFFGAIPMGLATILNGVLAFGPAFIGAAAVPVATALWWADAGLAVLCGLAIPYCMMTRQDHALESLTAVWLLPIVACEVAAVSAALLAPHLPASDAFAYVMLGYVLWALSVPLALSLLALLFLRLALHKLPPAEMGVTGWLALGPIGTGALALVLLGAAAPGPFAAHGLEEVGRIAAGVGVLGGLLLWGYGAWWLMLAVLATLRYLRAGLPFNLGWWGFTFPLAVYALATLALGHATGFALFTTGGTVLVGALAALWILVAGRTARGAWRCELFASPCIGAAARPRAQAAAGAANASVVEITDA